jgi:hypothetical protein
LDVILVSTLVASFATLVTAHLALAAGLFGKGPWSRGLAALLVPPLAPYFGFREKMWGRTILWALSLVTYVVALIAARRAA